MPRSPASFSFPYFLLNHCHCNLTQKPNCSRSVPAYNLIVGCLIVQQTATCSVISKFEIIFFPNFLFGSHRNVRSGTSSYFIFEPQTNPYVNISGLHRQRILNLSTCELLACSTKHLPSLILSKPWLCFPKAICAGKWNPDPCLRIRILKSINFVNCA